jgi:hypothetical protein
MARLVSSIIRPTKTSVINGMTVKITKAQARQLLADLLGSVETEDKTDDQISNTLTSLPLSYKVLITD